MRYTHAQGSSQAEAGSFAFCAALLVPLYMGRATEEVIFGPDSVTLSTSHDISKAGDLAHWLGLHSCINPANFGSRYVWQMHNIGFDPVSQYMDPRPVRFRAAVSAVGAALRCAVYFT